MVLGISNGVQGVESAVKTAPRLVLDLPNHKSPAVLLLRELPLSRRVKVVDVGANTMAADAPHTPLLHLGGCDVVGFEPQPAAFAALKKTISPRETFLPYAIGDGTKQTLRVYHDHGMSSFLPADDAGQKVIAMRPWSGLVDEIPLETKRLDDCDLGPFDLLKIDIQGAECMALAHGARALESATVVIAELRYFRLYQGEPMMGGLDTALRAMGFKLHKFLFTKTRAYRTSQSARLLQSTLRDQLIDGDGVYIRDLTGIETFTDDQLIHLAIMATAVFESHSVALLCLDHLVARGVISPDLPATYVDYLPAELRVDGDTAAGRAS